jgi:hypothetical protein
METREAGTPHERHVIVNAGLKISWRAGKYEGDWHGYGYENEEIDVTKVGPKMISTYWGKWFSKFVCMSFLLNIPIFVKDVKN